MNKNTKYLILSLLLLTCGFISATGQDDYDFGIYTKAGIKANISKKISNTTELEIRTKDNTTKLSNFRINTSFGYKFNKYLSTSIGYAYIGKPQQEISLGNQVLVEKSILSSHRYWVDITGSLPVSKFSFSLRERFQHTITQGASALVIRSELKVQYKIDNSIFRPFISVEPHLFLNDISIQTGSAVIENVKATPLREIRYNIGTVISINEKNDLQVYGRFTHNPDFKIKLMNQELPIKNMDQFILGINYHFKF